MRGGFAVAAGLHPLATHAFVLEELLQADKHHDGRPGQVRKTLGYQCQGVEQKDQAEQCDERGHHFVVRAHTFFAVGVLFHGHAVTYVRVVYVIMRARQRVWWTIGKIPLY